MDNDQDFTQQSHPPNQSPGYSYGRGELAPGTIVDGRYTVRHKLGEGGMAIVYLVEQIFLREVFALKVLTTGLSDAATVRFQKEAQVCRLLDHPNLIKVVDFAILENDSPYLVMEYVDGESLADILKRKGQLSEAETIDIFMQIMDGLAYAHEQNVIHRDLKPSNVMLANRSDMKLHVKILDFGIAKMTGQDSLNAMTLTNTGEIFGSPLFMSPEQCLGRRLDFRSDLYSIGCALYQVLTGAPPFSGDSALATMMLHLEGTPLPLRQASLGREFSPGIEKVVMKLLQKLPEERYQTARDVYDDLDAVKFRRSLKAVETKSKLPVSKQKGSPAVLLMVAVCVMLTIASLAALFLLKPRLSNTPSTAESVVEVTLGDPSERVSYFAPVSIGKWKTELAGRAPWSLNFPHKSVGHVALAGPPSFYEFTIHENNSLVAADQISFKSAGPLTFSTWDITQLKHFRREELEQLGLNTFELDDKMLEKIARYFYNLRSLYLDNCDNLSNKSIDVIATMPNLVYLYFQTPFMNMNSMKLGRMVANSRIQFFGSKLMSDTDAFCREISASKNLRSIKLDEADTTDIGFNYIFEISNLEDVQFIKNKFITDKSLLNVVKLKKLKSFLISESPRITADCISTLRKLPRGCRINLGDAYKWSEADKALFKKTFPDNRVP